MLPVTAALPLFSILGKLPSCGFFKAFYYKKLKAERLAKHRRVERSAHLLLLAGRTCFVGKELSADNTQPLRPGNAGVPGALQRTGAGQPGKMKTLGTGQSPGEDRRGEPCPETGRWDPGTVLWQHQQIP